MNVPQKLSEAPTGVYQPQPVIVHPGQTYSPAYGYQAPQIVVIQQEPRQTSWLRDHAGQIACAAGAGILVLAILLVTAIVAIAVGVASTGCAVGWVTIKTLSKKIEKK
ncbi:hypothetical protein [Streptomyces sp. NPDC018584]|uniref:hypothetical protein n=1 Tax=unclassified Streptomyces TaxID=2593676 RepID=UPI0037B2534C